MNTPRRGRLWSPPAVSRLRSRRTAARVLAALLGGALVRCAGPWELPALPGAASTRGTLPLVFGSEGNIVATSLDGRSRRQLTRGSGGVARDPAWSPDGTRIAYAYTPLLPATRQPRDLAPLSVTDVYVMDADGSNARVLLRHHAPGVAYATPVWAPDGESLFVGYTELVMQGNILKEQIDEVARVPLDGGPRRTVISGGHSPAVSPDATRVAFITGLFAWGRALHVADAAGGNVRTLVPPGRLQNPSAPRFSPDGGRIVFAADAPAGAPAAAAGPLQALRPRPVRAHGLPMDLFVVGADGGDITQLTHRGEDDPTAAWSPDGRRLAVLTQNSLYTVAADGSGLTQIAPSGGLSAIDWRP
jgi:Tol biopolymer transport system component